MMDARLAGCRVSLLPFDPLLLMMWIDLGLPELEGDIDPGELLLALLHEFDNLWLRIDDHSDQFGGDDQIKENVIHHAHIVVLKALLGRRGQNERGRCKRPGMVITCPDAAVIEA